MATKNLKITLTTREEKLLSKIEFDPSATNHGNDTRENCQRAAELANMLIKRKIIPAHRIAVFTEADYSTNRGTPPYEQFSRNGNTHEEILQHPHFLPWLRYFIYGPKLPQTLTSQVENKIDELGDLTSGDTETLRHFIRSTARKHKLIKSDADEVFKLIFEYDDNIDLAKTLRTEILNTTKAY
tara:strand:- start:55 stop:606 length:552 start_codon:yes stop_codon:yes gene_type:complete